ncbi:MAG TPA: prepilin-type N-terminal cleavage/methylation domain-containing protein [Myxococcaceae bacterium]|nr:prepilin-type N-terminal cleavage/methylation domain-containing protein [Myxococcaceae bacterium]
MRAQARQKGFTLLEVMIALAILGMSLMAIFQLNSQAVAMHAYTKRLTVASMLARAKMIDIEQELYDEGFQIDDQELSGGFEEEGWEMFKWRARIIAPETGDVSPEQFMGALFNLPIGDLGGDPLAAFAEMMGGSEGAAEAAGLPPGATPGMSPLAGMAGGLMQQQFDQMLAQIAQQVREIHLTVSWKDGDQVETLDVVTHVVAEGTGGDRNAPAAPGGATGPGGTPLPPAQGGGQVPIPGQNAGTPQPRGGLR